MHRILYFAPVDWFWIKQRPQQMVELLSKNNIVDYVNLLGFKSGSNRVVRMNDSDDLNEKVIYKSSQLTIYRHRILPKNHWEIGYFMNSNFVLKPFIKELYRLKKYDVIIITDPNQVNYFPKSILKNVKVIYDCMDNYTFGKGKNSLKKNEEKLLKYTNGVTVSSLELKRILNKKYHAFNLPIMVINNGVDLKNFEFVKKNNKNNRIGYVGTISEWFDTDLIKRFALNHSEYDFIIAGPIKDNFKQDLFQNINNIKLIGSIQYNSVAEFMSSCEVLLLPFKVNEFIESVDPVKIYEYLAMGKKVLSVSYRETYKFKNVIYLYKYHDYNDFNSKLLKLLVQEDNAEDIKLRTQFAKENSWENKVQILERFIEKV